ncbi:hypothetical protein E4U41_007591 [Claviceps citrina]|nr:hypothetical protein E4U41_007591 [Claviceps citrina]
MANSFASTPSDAISSPKILARDIATLGDAELDNYLDGIRLPRGDLRTKIEGWANLPKEKQDDLCQRIRIRARKADEVAKSRPLDLATVDAKLLKISPDNTSPRPVRSYALWSRTPSPVDWQRRECLWREHNLLISIGGRPWMPVELLEKENDPSNYKKVLNNTMHKLIFQSFFSINDSWDVYGAQVKRWLEFRDWQRNFRGIPLEEGFSEFADVMKPMIAYSIYNRDTFLFSEVDKKVRDVWESNGWSDDRKYFLNWMIRDAAVCGGFPAYVERTKRILAQHGVTQEFQLEEDLKRQDKLVEWIEYLGFECWWFDWHASSCSRRKSRYDEARKEKKAFAKQAADVMRPTPLRLESLTESERAQEEERVKRKEALKSKVEALKRHLADGRRTMEKHRVVMKWALKQLPLVEAELKESQKAESDRNVARGTNKRLRRDEDETTQDRCPKRQKPK